METLPQKPSLELQRKRAKALLRAAESGEPDAWRRIQTVHPNPPSPGALTLADAQLVIARGYGFESWAALRRKIDSLTKTPVEQFVSAVQSADAANVRALLAQYPEVRAVVNAPIGAFGGRPLTMARHNLAVIDVLLEYGADLNLKSQWWAGPFGILEYDITPEQAAPLIARGAVVDIFAAAHLDMPSRVRELVEADPSLVFARGGDGKTPLHCARSVEVASYLLERGADIDARDVDHESTPAQYLIRERQEVARHLVDRGARTDILMVAALGDLDRVRGHLDADPASIRTEVSDEFFPKIDHRAGGTIYIWTLGAHKTAHLIAREFGHEDVVRLLMERSPTELKLALASELGDEPLLRSLLERDPDLMRRVSARDRGRIVSAAQANNAAAVRLMVSAGWPLDARGQHGATALHWAAFHGNAYMVRQILGQNPPLEVKDHDFNGTPLGWAIHGSLHGSHARSGDYGGVVAALLDAGAKAPEITDSLQASEPVIRELKRGGRR